MQPAAVGILCGDESGKDQSAFQSDALCGMCSERAGRNRACISEGRTDFAQIDLSIAQENMWLETDAQGLGGVWIGIAPMEERMEEVHKLLELPKEVSVFSLFALGYPAESRAQEDRFHPERIHFLE